jgi:hypothetical protein
MNSYVNGIREANDYNSKVANFTVSILCLLVPADVDSLSYTATLPGTCGGFWESMIFCD